MSDSFPMVKLPFFEGQNRFVQILIFLALIVGCMIVASVLGVIVASIFYGFGIPTDNLDQAAYYRIIQSFGSVGTFMLPALLFSYLSERNLFSYNKLDKAPGYRLSNIVIVMSLVLLPIVWILADWNEGWKLPEAFAGLDEWMRRMDEQNSELVKLMSRDSRIGILLINIFVMAMLPAVGEELMFRGTVQPFLQKWTKSPHWAIWITAFIFSAIHFQISGFIPRMLIGAYLGYLCYWSGSLWLPILAHFMHNSMSILTDFIMLRRGFDVENMNYTDIHGWKYILGVAIILAIGGIYLLWRNRRIPENTEA
ncbi:MAG: CPBP family intramembrane metalloprotease [Bacteroidales bacterium]|nr:CPBP family intramembrane metalloprotease [Bacteroidales bacterium]